MGYNSAYVKDISKIFALDGEFSRLGYFGMASAQFLQKCTYVPPQNLYVIYIYTYKIIII